MELVATPSHVQAGFWAANSDGAAECMPTMHALLGQRYSAVPLSLSLVSCGPEWSCEACGQLQAVPRRTRNYHRTLRGDFADVSVDKITKDAVRGLVELKREMKTFMLSAVAVASGHQKPA